MNQEKNVFASKMKK